MWLSKEKRRLLLFYVQKAGQLSGNCRISNDELIRLMRFPNIQHLNSVKMALKEKNLIDFTYLEKHHEPLNVKGQQVIKEVEPNVTLTREGFELGMEYTTKLGTFQVWGKEYYWLWAFIGALASIVGIIISVVIGLIF